MTRGLTPLGAKACYATIRVVLRYNLPQFSVAEMLMLALAAARDPVDLRRKLLADNSRTLRALDLGAERAVGTRFSKGAYVASPAATISAIAPTASRCQLMTHAYTR